MVNFDLYELTLCFDDLQEIRNKAVKMYGKNVNISFHYEEERVEPWVVSVGSNGKYLQFREKNLMKAFAKALMEKYEI